MLSATKKRQAVEQVGFWWHSVDLGDGVVTPGAKTAELLEAEMAAIALPPLQDKTVLDIGGWDGYFAFAAERLGATRVAVVDHFVWSLDLPAQQAYWRDCQASGKEPEPYDRLPFWQPDALPGKAGFDAARTALNSRVESFVADFAHDDLAAVGTWDVTLFLGVLYHLEDPFAALKRLRSITREVAVVETAAIAVAGHDSDPLWRFFPGAALNGDSSNWWAPNLAGLCAMLEAAGFGSVAVQQGPPEPDTDIAHYRAIVHALV